MMLTIILCVSCHQYIFFLVKRLFKPFISLFVFLLLSFESYLEFQMQVFYLFNFPEEFVQNQYYFFLKCLVEFPSESTQPRVVFMGRILTKNLFNRYRTIQLVYFSMNKFWQSVFSRNLSLSSKLSNLLESRCYLDNKDNICLLSS